MYLDIVRDADFFRLLLKIDRDLEEQTRRSGCPHCGGHLHKARYDRSGVGGPPGLPPECRRRLSLCCGRRGCRRRVLPPSVLFMGRRWYWAPVILVAMVMLGQRTSGWNVASLARTAGIEASQATLVRWQKWFREMFPTTSWWQRLRGRISPVVRDCGLPDGLVLHFEEEAGDARRGLEACLRFLASGWLPWPVGHAG